MLLSTLNSWDDSASRAPQAASPTSYHLCPSLPSSGIGVDDLKHKSRRRQKRVQFIRRTLRIMAARRLQARATASSEGTHTYAQPTTTLALSTTFTPAASCAANKLTILPPPGYLIWANEPVPFPGTTVTDCYPSEFLKSYTSVSSGNVGSSVVPLMSPLVCPSNFCTQYLGDENYIACCPS